MRRHADGTRTGGWRKVWRDQRGQTFPFIVSVLFCLFLVVGVVINVGQAVNRRIYLQMLADTGAFTGATEMARGMNTLAQLNGRIQRAWSILTYATAGFTAAPSCAASDAAVIGYRISYNATNSLMNLVNRGYGQRAAAEARRVTQQNAQDLFPGESISMDESDGWGLKSPRPSTVLVNLVPVPANTPTAPEYPALSPAKVFAKWSCLPPPPPPGRASSFGVWFQKLKSPEIAFVWVVKAPQTRARFFDSFFGPYLIPEMTAAAAARPVGGEIKLAKDKYVAKMVPLRTLKGSVFDARYLTTRPVRH